jgi:hypothetical protein
MKSVIQLMSGGAAVVWKGTPTIIKVPFVFGIGILATAELTREVNEAWRSSRIFEGNAVQSDAQASNPINTLADLKAGKPTTAASANIAAQYQGLAADARTKTAEADAATQGEATLRAKDAQGGASSAEQLRLRDLDLKARDIDLRERDIELREAEIAEKSAIAAAANESEEELVGKLRRGIKLTSTENIRLQEIRSKRAEAGIKTAEESAAQAQADASRQGAEIASRLMRSMTGSNGSGLDIRGLSNNILYRRY